MGKGSTRNRVVEYPALPLETGGARSPRPRRVSVKGRRVGIAFEKKIIKRLGAWWADDPFSLYRSHGSGGRSTILSTDSGLYSGDVIPVKDVAQPWPFSVELKKSETFTLESILLSRKSLFYAFWKQCARDAARSKKIPLLICGKNHREPLVFFYMKDFDRLMTSEKMPPCAIVYPGGLRQRGIVVMPMRVFVASSSRVYIMENVRSA
jgi:hypothetical protein